MQLLGTLDLYVHSAYSEYPTFPKRFYGFLRASIEFQ